MALLSSSSSSAHSFLQPSYSNTPDGRDERRAPFFFFFSSFSLRVFLAILARAECVRWPQGLFGRTKGRKEGKLTHKPATWKIDSNLGGLVVIQSRRRGQAHPGRRRRAETDGNGDEGSKDPLDRPHRPASSLTAAVHVGGNAKPVRQPDRHSNELALALPDRRSCRREPGID